MRFGIEVPQDAPFATLVERWQRAEELGFDHLWVADHSADTRTDSSGGYRDIDGTWFDGWTVLAVMAMETTRQQNERLDEMCVAFGRDPTELRRSLFMVGALDAWASPGAVEQIVKRFGEIGIGEFVLFWPPGERHELFEHVATEVIPVLRMGLSL